MQPQSEVTLSSQAHTNSRTDHRQLIDDAKSFHRQAIDSAIKSMPSDVDRNYYSIAIIGVQNSGKSTLLNHLFGTNFDVLKEMAGTRTTRGILISLDKNENFIVFDVQGNDAMDRAEQQDYEKMVATYALITANVLIINIWCKALGGYTGSQYETLKVIMDICISQFKQQAPKTILFCVRDFNEQYDDEGQIRRKIQRDVNKLWMQLEKPEELQQYANKPQKFFTIEVCCLKRYRSGKEQAFIEDVQQLRQRFTNKKADGYIFAKQKIQYNLPISDFPTLCENSWKTIKQNKKLNLPNEKEQLANFRCTAISDEIQHQFEQKIKKLESQNLIADYGQIKEQTLKQFDEKTYHYGKKVSEVKRQQLVIKIDDDIKKVIVSKLSIEEDQIIKDFMNQSKNCAQNPALSLDDQLKKLLNYQVQHYISFMKKMNFQIPNRKENIQKLQSKLRVKFTQIKKNLLMEKKNQFDQESSRVIRLLGSETLKKYFGVEFWTQAKMSFYEKNTQLVEKYSESYAWVTGESLSPGEYDNLQEKNEADFLEIVKSELEKTLDNRAFEYFLSLFRKQQDSEDKINFNLKTEEQIAEHFDKTRDKTIYLIKKLNQSNNQRNRRSSMFQMSDQGQQTFFQSTWLSTVSEKIDKKMIDQYEKIIRRKKQGAMNEVPIWLYGIILYFLYDDLWFSAEQSPIIHYILIAIVLLCVMLVAIGQGRVLKEGIRIIVDSLKQKLPFLR